MTIFNVEIFGQVTRIFVSFRGVFFYPYFLNEISLLFNIETHKHPLINPLKERRACLLLILMEEPRESIVCILSNKLLEKQET